LHSLWYLHLDKTPRAKLLNLFTKCFIKKAVSGQLCVFSLCEL